MNTFEPSPEQQAIIGHPLEPLRVVAGAGTGKTTTMAKRLAALVRSGGLEPEEALGITFTNKAAEELAERLRLELPDHARDGRRVEVATYHGFAHGILREFGAIVGVRRDAPILSPGSARQLLTEAAGTVDDPALDLSNRAARVGELATLSSRLGDHLGDPADLTDRTDTTEASTGRRALAAALTAYEQRKRDLGFVDYGDLIRLAHRIVTEHPSIAARLRGRYRIVLLDEYQDTNPAQRELLRALFGNGFPVTAVGDPDQTIYEWRGASLGNFARFPDHFPTAPGQPATDTALSVNRRSGHAIVDFAESVRAQIGGGGVERLRALEAADEGRVEVARLRTAVDEAEWVAERIHGLHEASDLEWRDIAVLFRRHRQIVLVREALERRGVPVEVAALGGLLDIPEVADLHAWLRVLGRTDDAPALARLLLGSSYRLGLGDLAPLAGWLRGHRRPTHDDEGIGPSLLEAVDRLDEVPGISPTARPRLERFRRTYRLLLEQAQVLGLAELCRSVLDATNAWLEVEALNDAARLSARLNLYRFLDLADAWSPVRGTPTLEAFLDHLDLLQDEAAAEELDTASVGGEDAVALLTVHRAKGLEWTAVFLPALAEGIFPSTYGALPDPHRRPDHLPDGLRLDADWRPPPPDDPEARKAHFRAERDAQEWRTAYVAVTRARELLVCSSAHWYSERRPRNPSPILSLADAFPASRRATWIDEPGTAPDALRLSDEGLVDPDLLPGGWRAILGEAIDRVGATGDIAADLGVRAAYDDHVRQLRMTLDGLPADRPEADGSEEFRTSVTGLVTYATCPKRFYWSEVDRLPRRPSPALRRGIELHRKIELHNRGSMALEEADESFFDAPDRATESAAKAGFTAFLESRYAKERPRFIEAPFDLAVDGARVSGRIDAVYEFDPGSWDIVDFKSGKGREPGPQIVQLEAYALAVTDAGFAASPPDALSASFVYLGDGLTEHRVDITDAWLENAREHVRDIVGRARQGSFDPEPSEACTSCDFARFCDAGTAWLERQA